MIDQASNSVTDTVARGGTSITVNPATGTVYEPTYSRVKGAWVITPAAANSWSPLFTSGTPSTFSTGQSGSFTFAADGRPAPTFTETGTLPAGLTMSADGTLSGTPTADAGGLYPISVSASNGVSPAAHQTFDLTVDQPTVITSPSSATFEVGTTSSIVLTSTGYPGPADFSEIGFMPIGLTIAGTASGWLFGGDPPVGSGGVYPITIEATFGSVVATQEFTFTINEAPSFSSGNSATFRAGSPSRFQVSANGFPKPSVAVSGKLPPGVSLSSAHVLTGTPAPHSGGSYHVRITASNSIASIGLPFTLTVHQVPAITSGRSATFRIGRHHTFTIRSTGFPTPRVTERGRLPKGLRFTRGKDGTANLTGTPARTDARKTYVITIIAGNGIGSSARQTCRLKIT